MWWSITKFGRLFKLIFWFQKPISFQRDCSGSGTDHFGDVGLFEGAGEHAGAGHAGRQKVEQRLEDGVLDAVVGARRVRQPWHSPKSRPRENNKQQQQQQQQQKRQQRKNQSVSITVVSSLWRQQKKSDADDVIDDSDDGGRAGDNTTPCLFGFFLRLSDPPSFLLLLMLFSFVFFLLFFEPNRARRPTTTTQRSDNNSQTNVRATSCRASERHSREVDAEDEIQVVVAGRRRAVRRRQHVRRRAAVQSNVAHAHAVLTIRISFFLQISVRFAHQVHLQILIGFLVRLRNDKLV